jgi:energy-coupling factor transport system substrate-specific component
MIVSRRKQFLLTFLTFFVLGAAFKVMVLVEGLTEVRPANAIPPVAGLAFGPVGAIACGLANLAADMFGSFGPSSILGLAANFIAAFLPYRLWHLFSAEPPNLHTGKNILLYLATCLVSALTVSWFLAFGLYTFFGLWIEQIYTYVLFNDFGFSVMFGLPLLIVVTSDDVDLQFRPATRHLILTNHRQLTTPLVLAYTLIMFGIFASVFGWHLSPQSAPWLQGLSALSLVGLLAQIV